MQYKRIAIDTAKSVFSVHAIDESGRVVLRRDLRRRDLVRFFEKQCPTEVVLEACASSHHWGRVLAGLGHTVKLIPPHYVKPFVRRNKTDRNDAEAICTAASIPDMPSVPVKTAAQQADAMILSVRALLVRQRTQLVNALRGHAAEFGVVVGKGIAKVAELLRAVAAEPGLPTAALTMLELLGKEIAALDQRLADLDVELADRHKQNAVSQALDTIPGFGRLLSLTLALRVDAAQFKDGRHFASWVGLTPKQNSSGGKTRMGGISREGHEEIRHLLVVGAMAVIAGATRSGKPLSPWLTKLLERKPRKLVACALANKMARIAWAMMTTGELYRKPEPQALSAA